jgi:hypothetical protein
LKPVLVKEISQGNLGWSKQNSSYIYIS